MTLLAVTGWVGLGRDIRDGQVPTPLPWARTPAQSSEPHPARLRILPGMGHPQLCASASPPFRVENFFLIPNLNYPPSVTAFMHCPVTVCPCKKSLSSLLPVIHHIPQSYTASCLTGAVLEVGHGPLVKFHQGHCLQTRSRKGVASGSVLRLGHHDSNLSFPLGGMSSNISFSKRSEISLLALLKTCL